MSIWDIESIDREMLENEIEELKRINANLRQELDEAQQNKKLNDDMDAFVAKSCRAAIEGMCLSDEEIADLEAKLRAANIDYTLRWHQEKAEVKELVQLLIHTKEFNDNCSAPPPKPATECANRARISHIQLQHENEALKYVLHEERESYKRLDRLYDILHKAITDSRCELQDDADNHLTTVELEKLEKQLFTAGLDIKLIKNNEKYLDQELVQRLCNLQNQYVELSAKKSCWNKVSVAEVNKLNEKFRSIGLNLHLTSRNPDTLIADLSNTLAVIYNVYQEERLYKLNDDLNKKLGIVLNKPTEEGAST